MFLSSLNFYEKLNNKIQQLNGKKKKKKVPPRLFQGGGGSKQSDTKINSTKYSSNKTKMSNMRIKILRFFSDIYYLHGFQTQSIQRIGKRRVQGF